MKILRVLAALLLTTALAASPWGDFVQRRRSADPRQAKWTLCVRPGDFGPNDAYKDPVFQKLLTSGDFGLESLAAPAAQDLWSQRGWGTEPHWLLLAPAGEEAAQGRGRPRGAEILDGIHAAGGKPRWEAREAFLKEHPHQGEARLEAVNQAFQILRMRLLALDREGKVKIAAWHQDPGARARFVSPRISLPPGTPADLADGLYGEVAEALERLLELPGWEHEAGSVATHLAQWDLSHSLRLKKLFTRAAAQLEECLKREPYDAGLTNFWMEARDAAGLGVPNLAGLCLPVPGQPWPDAEVVPRFLESCYRRSDWQGALKLISDLAPQGPPEPVTAHGWESYRRLQGALLAQRGLALGGLGSWDAAGSALAEARAWTGSQGVRMALLQRGSLFSGPGPEPSPWRLILAQATQGRDPEPPEMPEPDAPLRLVVGGMPRWILDWTALREAPELAFWSPAELHWEVADRAAHEAQQARFGWEPGPRWALYRGEDLLASGRTCPEARGLAAILEANGSTQLHRLQQVVATQPDHEEAHWERFHLLEKRMPDRRLEPLMAQDGALAEVTLDFDPDAPWKPDPSLWAAAAQKVLPALEETLRCWPNRAPLWRAWISWARFHPRHPQVLALAQGLAFWSPKGDWRAWLPYEVQRSVAAELRRQGNFAVMREWFRSVWESLDQRPLRLLHRGEQQWVLERRREEETAVFQPLRDALAALSCTQEQAELERVFGEMMGRAPSRRP